MMRTLFSTLLAALSAMTITATGQTPDRGIENVAAFARLYGVVRYFYPSDAAAELDWNRFAIHGVARVRPAGDAAALGDTLAQLFQPLGPGIEVGFQLSAPTSTDPSDEALVAWRYLGAGFSANAGPYRAKRTHREAPVPQGGGFATLMQMTSGEELRGKTIRLRARVRAMAAQPTSGAALWLRVDRPSRVMGFFDNMGDRLVRETEWKEYAIEGPVAEDAENVAFGVMAVGGVTADFDAVELAVKGDEHDWTPVPIEDASFEATPEEDDQGGWFRTGMMPARITRPEAGAPDGRRYIRFAPPPPGAADVELFEGAAPRPGDHVDVDLGSGLRARVPLALPDSEARSDPHPPGDLVSLTAALEAMPGAAAGSSSDLDRRLADVVVAWNVFRHFYPYWKEAEVNWDARLRPQLERAAAAGSRTAQRDALRRLVTEARDGHAGVTDILDKEKRAQLPVSFAVIEDRLVIATSAVPEEAPVGAVVSPIAGTPASEWLDRELSLSSGSPQWQRVRVLWDLMGGPEGETVTLGLDAGSEAKEVTLAYGSTPPPPEARPDPITELEKGIWYVDLTRAKTADVAPQLDDLAAARAVVFDVRGYPTDAGAGMLPHLLGKPEETRWMHVARLVGPDGRAAGWDSQGWHLKPKAPQIGGTRVFLTDGRAISYAESVMGYVADLALGTIVGSTTAGTNGNVASFTTPGGFNVRFTGMRVTGHDGTSPFHLIGVRPDVPVSPTTEDVRAGRDPVLARGLAFARRSDAP
jgi:hypothetical protein